MRIVNSLGIFEESEWQVQAASTLRRMLKDRDMMWLVPVAQNNVNYRNLLVEYLRTHGYSEIQLRIHSLYDHIPSILELINE